MPVDDEFESLYEGSRVLPALIAPALILGIPLACGAVGWGLTALRERRRRPHIAAAAAKLGFRFHPGLHPFEVERVPVMRTQDSDETAEGYNAAVGTVTVRGREVEACFGDYYPWTTQKNVGPHATRPRFTSYVAVTLPFHGVPELTAWRGRWVGRRPGYRAMEQVTFESAKFNQLYTVLCRSRRFAFDLFEPPIMKMLVDEPVPLLTAHGDLLMVTGVNGRRWSAAQFEAKLRWAVEFVERWPEHIVAELGPPAGEGGAAAPRRYGA